MCRRENIYTFFRKIHGKEFIECEADHFYVNEFGEENKQRSKTCCFNKTINKVLQDNHIQAAAVRDYWGNSGLDIMICAMIKGGNTKVVEILGENVSDLNKLTGSISRMGCF